MVRRDISGYPRSVVMGKDDTRNIVYLCLFGFIITSGLLLNDFLFGSPEWAWDISKVGHYTPCKYHGEQGYHEMEEACMQSDKKIDLREDRMNTRFIIMLCSFGVTMMVYYVKRVEDGQRKEEDENGRDDSRQVSGTISDESDG